MYQKKVDSLVSQIPAVSKLSRRKQYKKQIFDSYWQRKKIKRKPKSISF